MIRVHGLDLSYFTGKVEAYLRARGIPYELVPMDTRSFRRLGRITGVRQMPQVELADGTWLTDSTHIIETLERTVPGARVYPQDAALDFIAHLLEDFADEWLWRPAMAYRWEFEADRLRAGHALASVMLRDVPLPLAARRFLITFRQRHLFVRGDGVDRSTRAAVLAVYPKLLRLVEPLFTAQPYLLGERPTQADFGLMGPMYRHFGTDPTPREMMQRVAPASAAWVQRVWNATPAAWADRPQPETVPELLFPLLATACNDYLPYLRANAAAVRQGARHVTWVLDGTPMRTPASAYRAGCLRTLARRFAGLRPADAQRVQHWLSRNCGRAITFE